MKYFYDTDSREYLTLDELRAEYKEQVENRYTEDETFEEFLRNCCDFSLMGISEKVYTERSLFTEVECEIRHHIASDNAYWHIDINDTGTGYVLMCEDTDICAIELADIIPALDYLYSVVNMDSTAEEDAMALDTMISTYAI